MAFYSKLKPQLNKQISLHNDLLRVTGTNQFKINIYTIWIRLEVKLLPAFKVRHHPFQFQLSAPCTFPSSGSKFGSILGALQAMLLNKLRVGQELRG
eukprot:scaffold177930_cov18-Tisochrysis_lutea.AAC.2